MRVVRSIFKFFRNMLGIKGRKSNQYEAPPLDEDILCECRHTYYWHHDEFQDRIIQLEHGCHLVIAPPGCGKTYILAERVARALSAGIAADDILCLTFTNRASREMYGRIEKRLGAKIDKRLFVGNVHRFCSAFLYAHDVIGHTCAILDEDETYKIMLGLTGHDEDKELGYSEKERLCTFIKAQHLVFQLRSGHSEELLIHKSLYLEYKDILAEFHESAHGAHSDFVYLYDNLECIDTIENSIPLRSLTEILRCAKLYGEYKRRHSLIDFDDLLIMTYNYLYENIDKLKTYPWILVDEVQDLNRLQLAIIDLLYDKGKQSVAVYLGDDRQSIFSFIGADTTNLNYLKRKCGGRVVRLYNNYRSPKYLLDVFNTYAHNELGIAEEDLPNSTYNVTPKGDELKFLSSMNGMTEVETVVKTVQKLCCSTERTAILVSSNAEADLICDALDKQSFSYFKVSGTDVFSEPLVQTVIAHLNVLSNELNPIAWTRILVAFNAFKTLNEARQCLMKMDECLLYPTDFLQYSGNKKECETGKAAENKSYSMDFCRAFEEGMVIFDTETTGLDVFSDDIVQIAAVKVKGGIVVDSFNVLLETEKNLPSQLGDEPNPLVELYHKAEKTGRVKGLEAFLSFAGNLPLVGHNVQFDSHILYFNVKRYCAGGVFKCYSPIFFDTLKLIRIVEPNLHSYKLKNVLALLNLEGKNTHLADDDTMATFSLVGHIVSKAKEKLPKQDAFREEYGQSLVRFSRTYAPFYWHTAGKMLERQDANAPHCAIVSESMYLYEAFMRASERLKPVRRFRHVVDFLDKSIVDITATPTLAEQLQRHIMDLNTYKETDICAAKDKDGNDVVKENCFVSTVHKAKGLEFDNVIVTGVNKGAYPFYNNVSPEQDKEDARKLYVAITRAKKRLYLSRHERNEGVSRYGNSYSFDCPVSPFVRCIADMFTSVQE